VQTVQSGTFACALQLQEIRDYNRSKVPLGLQQISQQDTEDEDDDDDDVEEEVTEEEEVHAPQRLSLFQCPCGCPEHLTFGMKLCYHEASKP
jgi:hypothetical protein